MVIPNVDWSANCTVGHRHHDGQSQPRRVVYSFHHEKQTLRSRGRIGSRPGHRRAD